ncbi:MAG: hypothetical protein AUK48_15260 [Oscillatoriales cyanobacterium CG2_30_44_21]|nr:MAG: hypothetical protein AUK48_15260 [Oscillatoriales cyanobacterium CG2_30_44_21]
MRLMFDQNLSRKLAGKLADIFPDCSHVQFHDLDDKTDTEIWEFAKINDLYIVTQDADFAERSRLYGSPPKVTWLRCGNVPTIQVEQILRFGSEVIQGLEDAVNIDCLEIY